MNLHASRLLLVADGLETTCGRSTSETTWFSGCRVHTLQSDEANRGDGDAWPRPPHNILREARCRADDKYPATHPAASAASILRNTPAWKEIEPSRQTNQWAPPDESPETSPA